MVPLFSKEVKFEQVMLFCQWDIFVGQSAFVAESTATMCGEVETHFLSLSSLWFMLLELFVFGLCKLRPLLILPYSFLCGRCSGVVGCTGGYTTGA